MATKKSKIGCLFWVALILLIIVIFLFNRERIKNVLESTGFTTFISKRKEEKEEEKEGPEVIQEETEGEQEEETPEDGPTVIEIGPEEAEPEISVEEEDREVEPADMEKQYRNAKLYFIDVGDDGVISLQAVVRQVAFSDSPLTETLEELLEGMLPSELNMELISLIPEKTQLLSVRVDDGIAYIDFNESFRFNSLGKEGYVAQLKQIIYTATEFSTVESVQILIEGETHDYLGPEGVFIGQPLTRNSFN